MTSTLGVGAVLATVIWLRPADDERVVKALERVQPAVRAAGVTPARRDGAGELLALESELRETGRVVRRRSGQAAPAAAGQDVPTSRAIEAAFDRDPRLSALQIEVVTSDGRVTLVGHVQSAADLARAIEIAFAHPSVRQVVSTLQIARPVAQLEPQAAPR